MNTKTITKHAALALLGLTLLAATPLLKSPTATPGLAGYGTVSGTGDEGKGDDDGFTAIRHKFLFRSTLTAAQPRDDAWRVQQELILARFVR